jgi:hypothetical protein
MYKVQFEPGRFPYAARNQNLIYSAALEVDAHMKLHRNIIWKPNVTLHTGVTYRIFFPTYIRGMMLKYLKTLNFG